MGVVDHAVDNGGQVPRDLHDKRALRQLGGAQMDLAARADLHGRGPTPAEGFKMTLISLAVYTSAAVRSLLLASADPFHHCQAVKSVVDLPVGLAGRNRNRTATQSPVKPL